MKLETQQDFEEAAREITQYLMRLDDRVMANKIYDFMVALNNAGQVFRKKYEAERELGDQYYQQLKDTEAANDRTFEHWLIALLGAALKKAPEYRQNSGIAYLVFYADGSGGLQENLNDGWNTVPEFVAWLRNQKPSSSEKS